MVLWLDAHLPPALAPWMVQRFGVSASSVYAEGHASSKDREIFAAARLAHAVIVTKDSDFVDLVARLGTPPQVLLISVGNASNAELRRKFEVAFPRAVDLLQAGEAVVELR